MKYEVNTSILNTGEHSIHYLYVDHCSHPSRSMKRVIEVKHSVTCIQIQRSVFLNLSL